MSKDVTIELADMRHILRVLKDKDEIRDLLARASLAADRADIDALAACFHPDAYDMHLPYFEGPVTTLMQYYRQNELSGPEVTQFNLGTNLIELDGDTARSQCYAWSGKLLRETDQDGVGLTRLSGLRYLDRLERRDGEWRISRRTCVFEWGVNVPVPTKSVGMFKVTEDQDRPGLQSRRDKSDMSYKF